MSNYTQVNLPETEDMSGGHGMSDILAGHFVKGALDCEKTGLSLQRIKPGMRLPFGHRHKTHEEIYVVVSGSGRMKIEDDIVDLQPLDAVRVAPEAWRSLEAGDDGLEVLAFGTSTDEREAEMQQGWWAD